MRFVAETVTDLDRVRVTVGVMLRDTDTVYDTEGVPERVKGLVVGMPVVDLVSVTDLVRLTETVPERVKGLVVGMPVFDLVSVTDVV